MTGNPQLALNLLKLFCKRIYDQIRRFRILVIKDPQARLANVFIMLNEMYPSANPDSRICKFNVTVADVAQWAGLSQDVTRTEINRFVEKRRIEVFDNYIIVSNISDMKRIARAAEVAQQYILANLAHLVEQRPRNAQVLGSSPGVGSKTADT